MKPNSPTDKLVIKMKNKEDRTILTKRGYSIIKKHYTLQEIEDLKKTLHVNHMLMRIMVQVQNHTQSI